MKKVWIPVVVACLLGLLSAMVGIGMAIGYLPYADVALAGAFYIGIPLTLVSLLLLALPRVRRTWVPGIGLGMA
ncbi:MAG: hypothetical protein LBN38_00335, partial [Verrucomicrobiota bacterium]|nr:hypothetical protein [Verrucomicrobiota bacterium]